METASNTRTKNFLEYIPTPQHAAFLKHFSDRRITDSDSLQRSFAQLRRCWVSQPVIYVGCGTCGLGAGAQKTVDAVRNYLRENKIEAEVIEVGCIGLCNQEPLLDVQLPQRNRLTFAEVSADMVTDLLDKIFQNEIDPAKTLYQYPQDSAQPWPGVPFMPDYPFFAKQKRWVLANCGVVNPVSIEEYIAGSGYTALARALNQYTRIEICDIIEKSGLRGRGGGGFPTGKKWKFALGTPAEQKYIICNADEGDPGAFMDRAVIEGDPHRVLEGLAIGAYAIGASTAYVYIRAEYPLAIKHLEKAIEDAKRWHILGENIFDSGFDLKIVIKKGAGAFVCGEETALIHSIEGKRGMPRPRPPFPAVKGLFDCPTVINNVETLANVPGIVLNGHEWFAGIGTASSKGTKVFALSGKVTRTGLVEVPMGVTMRDIIFDIGGGIPANKGYKAVQIGGPSGGCIPEKHLDIQIDYESLKTVGAMMGSGGLVVMDEDNCMVDVAKFFMEFIQRESCGKCIPCREGTKRLLEILQQITRGRKQEEKHAALERFRGVVQFEQLAKVIQETSLCGLGQTAPNPVLSTLRWFRDEYEAHIFERRCPAGACAELIAYHVDEGLCKGCTLCAKKCPNNAITGSLKAPHYIIEERCIKCGICKEVCRFGAVSKS
jgi:NADH:ubiquinone oxidoreductase subunit F (NADH-binding)/Pyruvate/2-oxoacid:ferredoxin oxidoreductase delta subunit